MEQSTIISVSSTNPSFNCKNVSEKLKDCGIECKLTQNNSIVKKGHRLFAEIGCNIELYNFDNKNLKTQVWEPLKHKYNFDCAHLSVSNEYGGCIHDYLKDPDLSCRNK
tara:strand:+ start:207 stop:533 length:327 start_codon:yes stop_codon:yes gene_type:complete